MSSEPTVRPPEADLMQAVAEYGQAAGDQVTECLAWATRVSTTAARARGIEVATILAGLRIDVAAVQAALVRPACEDGTATADVELHVGADVAKLAEGVARLEHIRWDHLEQEAPENLRKMFLAVASDIRVVLLALAERVALMRGLDALPEIERRGLAHETLEVYAPLANRLGIFQIKWELEDLAFRALQPEVYREIKRLLAQKRAARMAAVDEVTRLLQGKLAEVGIAGSIGGRAKHIYSIYQKMQRKKLGYEQIYDVSAVRVLVDRIEDCYAVLGMVHAQWTPIDGEFDDYIAKPKGNDYRSLHTAVLGPDGKPLEVQIRTHEMHEFNEFGVAAHWRYKESASRADRRFDAKINWLRQLMAWQKDVTDPRDLADSLRTDLFKDQVYVFTPTGEVVDLPQGATPVDFAYRIHTQVGHRCRGARVNGQIVPLDYELHTGDRAEIITAKGGKPSRDWLNPHLGYVRTASAKQKIRQYFRTQQRDSAIAAGKESVEREIKRLGLDARVSLQTAMGLYPKYQVLDDFLAAVGFGDIVIQSVTSRLLEFDRGADAQEVPVETSPAEPPSTVASEVSIAGVDDVMSYPARCCNPVPGDEVVGYITRGRGLAIHRVDCSNARLDHEPERWMPLSWGARHDQRYPVALQIVADDRPGLLRDVVDVVAAEGVNLAQTSAVNNAKERTSTISLTLEVKGSEQAVRIMNRVERLGGIRSVRRLRA